MKPAWDRASEQARTFNSNNATTLRKGVGIGTCWYGCGNTSLPNPSTIRIGITGEGTLILHQGAMDIGQGSNTVRTVAKHRPHGRHMLPVWLPNSPLKHCVQTCCVWAT